MSDGGLTKPELEETGYLRDTVNSWRITLMGVTTGLRSGLDFSTCTVH